LDLLAQRRIPTDSDDKAVLDSVIVHGHAGFRELAEYSPRVVASARHTIADAFSYGFAYGMRFGVIVAAGAAVLGLLLLRRPREQARWAADDRPAPIDRPTTQYG
jgi:hypothetical protein